MSRELPFAELVEAAALAGVPQIMAATKRHKVVVDYFPARSAISYPREPDDEDGIDPFPIRPVTLTYTLEDAMLGGVVFASLVCGHRIILHPFPWEGFHQLADIKLEDYLVYR